MLVKRLIFSALVMFAAFYLAACGGSSKSGGGGSTNPAITIGSATLPTGYAGSNYTSTTLTASGGSGTGFTWSVSGGTSLPTGITLSSGGVVGGKPTAEGSTSFTVKVTDSASASATASLSITVKAGVIITTAAGLPDGYIGSAYAQTLAAKGGTGSGYTWALASGSALPDGLALSAAGVLSGKPTTVGSPSFSISVTDSAQNSATVQLSAAIKAGVSITTLPALPTAYVGTPYGVQLTAIGGSGTGYTWTLVNAAAVRAGARRMVASSGLPDGLNLSSDGWITGTPTTAGNSTAVFMVTDSAGNTATVTVSFTIGGGITITTATTLPRGRTADPYSTTFAATGGSGHGYTWAVTNGMLPAGLQLSPDGILSGNLPAAKAYTFDVTVTDSDFGTASATFTLTVTNELRFVTSSLISPYVGIISQQTLKAKGGSGGGYVYTLNSGSALPAGFTLSSAGVLGGKASAAGSFDFGVTVTDSAENTATANFSLTINAGVTITSPATLPAATVGSAYLQSLTATGGSGSGYIWTLTSGASSLSAVGLNFSTSGVLSGIPPSTGTATFSVSLTDSSNTHATGTFTVSVEVAGTGSQISGHIMLGNTCGNVPIPTITVSISTNPVQKATTDSNGNYSFPSVPGGSYTITPSITGPSSIFYPASMPVTVSGAAISSLNFTASLGYTVSGTVTYSGSQTGQTYIWLMPKNCGSGLLGDSMSAPGAFTIHGVPPGSYTLAAGIDQYGFGYPNASDAGGVMSSDVTVDTTNVTGTSVTMIDPTQVALTLSPGMSTVTPTDNGIAIGFSPITGQGAGPYQIELASSYDIQWATDAGFTSIAGKQSFSAGASNGTGVIFVNNSTSGITGSLTTGTTYYFRARAVNGIGNGPWKFYSTDGTNPAPVQIGAPSGSVVSGMVTFTGAASGPLYVGFYDLSTGAVFATQIVSPVSPQPYSVQVPNGSAFFHFAVLDQNNDGMIDRDDISNTRNDNIIPISISGTRGGLDLTLNTPNSKAIVTTVYVKSNNQDGTVVDTYGLNFNVREGNKLPVSVRLLSGPHIINPIDLGQCPDCGNVSFQYFVAIDNDIPTVGDSYTFKVTYSDTTAENLTAAVTGVLGASQFVTDLSPNVTIPNLQPTFGWTYPANPSNYTYQFGMFSNGNGDIWDIPANNTNSKGFNYSDIPLGSINWGVDPTNPNNTPMALSSQTTYSWWVTTFDSNNNSAQVRTYFVTP